MGSENGQRTRVAAIYARVSSERQRQAETIQSQLVALRELAGGRGLQVTDDLVFEDEGFSGATLIRPALERLRDRAAEGAFEVLLCHAPDRLARRYAYQVLLLEELARVGVEVIFAKEPERSGSPEDELLRQFQGMISEYERAQIAERTRRGTLHRARAGAVAVLSRAPYGYRYIRKSEHVDAFLEIDEAQARIVREIFDRYARDGESVGAIARAERARGADQDRCRRLEPVDDLGDAAQPGLRRSSRVRQDAHDRAARAPDAYHASARRALRRAGVPAGGIGAVDLHSGAGADRRGDLRARPEAADGRQAALAAQHPPAVAVAGDPRVRGLRLRLLPQPDHDPPGPRLPLLPLLGQRRLASPARAGVRQSAGTPGAAGRARLERGAPAARRSRADPGRDPAPA
jgi:DNA invertase Pin-like site-specific DNA recombinase